MIDAEIPNVAALERRIREAEATIQALVSREVDAVVDPRTNSPVLLAQAQQALHQSEHALRVREAEYRQIVESTTDGIIKVDPDGKIGFVNARLAEMLGYAPGELLGTSLLTVLAPSEHADIKRTLHGRLQGVTTAHDTVYRHKSGLDIAVNIAGSVLRDEQGQIVSILGIVRDVTERNKLQAQLIASDRMASVGTLAAGVAHEINNPLAAVTANLEFISEELAKLADPEDAQWIGARIAEPLADAREAAERVRFIVRDLMIFSRSPKDETQLAIDVNEVLESSLRMALNEIRHRAYLVKNLGNVPLVRGNEARLGQVFLNLIVNAAQSLPVGHLEQHKIRLTTSQTADTVVIEIADSGAGIAPESIGRIFDAFYTTKAVGVGTGLGLAICQRIVTDMGGTLTVNSTVGVGSTFRVALPIALEAVEKPAVAAAPSLLHGGGYILVVDDDEVVSRSVQRGLGDSYEILTATSAWAALALIEAGQRFDLILCDLMMPNMTGMELYKALQLQVPGQEQRMIFMTGGAFTAEAREFITRPEITHVEKPFTFEALRATVHQYFTDIETIF